MIFYISEAFKSIFRYKLSSMLSIISLSIGVLLITTSLLLLLVSAGLEDRLKSKIELNIFISDDLDNEEINNLKKDIMQVKGIRRITFLDKETAYAKFKKETGQDFSGILSANPLPNSFKINFQPEIDEAMITSISGEIKKMTGVDDVVYDYKLILILMEFIKSVKILVYFGALFFLIISFYLIYSNNKLILNARMVEFNTMKLVGAKLSTIKIPLMIKGIIYGIIAALINSLFFYVIFITFIKYDIEIQFVNTFYFFNLLPVVLSVLLGVAASGLFTKKLTLQVKLDK